MRTPLNGILGYAELVRDDAQDEDARQYGQIIHQSAEHLVGLVNTILDLAKIESGRMVTRPSIIELGPLLEEVRQCSAGHAQARGLRLETSLMPDLPAPGPSADGRARTRSAWVAIDDEAQAHAIARALVLAGWEVGHVVHGCAAVHALARDAARLPDVLVTGLRFRDGDGLRLIRELGAFPDAPAVFLASRQQRAVIKAAQTLADACGLRFAGAAEQPADVAGIVAQLAGFHPAAPASRAGRNRPRSTAPGCTPSSSARTSFRGCSPRCDSTRWRSWASRP